MADVLRSKLFWIGLAGVSLGFLVPFLQIIGVLPYGIILSSLGWACSIGGLFLGIISAATAYHEHSRPDPRDDMWSG